MAPEKLNQYDTGPGNTFIVILKETNPVTYLVFCLRGG